MTPPEQMDAGKFLEFVGREFCGCDECIGKACGALESARQQGYLQGLEDAAGMVELGFGLDGDELTWDMKDRCMRLSKSIRALKPNEGKT